jgi:septal ring factor EnvC (AmiA/AmiB activator)
MQAELATVKDELAVTQAEKHALQMQMAEKERALQATKADLIETRLELQRTEARLDVRLHSMPSQHACTCMRVGR